MTVIIGYVDRENKKMIFSGDTCIGYSSYYRDRVRDKIHVYEDYGMILGYVGSWLVSQTLKNNLIIPEYTEGTDVETYIVRDLAEAMKDAVEDKITETTPFGALIGFKGRVFEFDEKFCMTESYRDFTCAGSGGEFAAGCLYTLQNSGWHAKDKLQKAMECSEEFTLNVKEPFKFYELSYETTT